MIACVEGRRKKHQMRERLRQSRKKMMLSLLESLTEKRVQKSEK